MSTDDRILLISATDDDSTTETREPFRLTLQREDGTRVVPTVEGPSGWLAAVREQQWDFVVCRPDVLREHAFDRGQCDVLELIAAGVPLNRQLEELVLLIEAQAPNMICSILLLDRLRGTLTTGAAPHLPPEYVKAIDGSKIGPTAGSCGTAAYRNELVIVEDIATHEYWDDYRQFALPHGLRACWSSPIVGTDQRVLGTFAMYFHQPRSPGPLELHWIDRASKIAAVAIERAYSEATQRRHALVHDLLSDVVFYLSVESEDRFRFLSVNPAFCAATGLERDEIVGRMVEDVIPPESLPEVLDHYRQAIKERRTVRWYEVSTYPAGIKHGLVSITPIVSPDGRCTNLVGTVHDITELQRAHQRIAAQAALLDQAHDAILVWDIDTRIQYWNEGAERLYGWSRIEAEGQPAGKLIHKDPSQFEAAHHQLLEADVWRGELIQQTREGQVLVSEVSWSLARDERGRPKSVLAINTDVTERRRLEARVFRGQRLESMGLLASGIAHDFNNILTVISGNADLASATLGTDAAREALIQITMASEHGAKLVQQLLTFGRQQEPKRKPVELSQIVSEAASLLRGLLPKTVEISMGFAPNVPRILADSTQIHQVVVNLVSNAAQAMAEDGGVLSIRVDHLRFDDQAEARRLGLRRGAYARLVVSDTGRGMDEATLERIFDPFFTTKAPSEGTGLGLAVVHGIVKSHHGAIIVHSTVGSGTEFEVYLPIDDHS